MEKTERLSKSECILFIIFIIWNLTTQCLAVTGGDSVGKCGRLSQSNWLLGAL